jgi:hypothetical protein
LNSCRKAICLSICVTALAACNAQAQLPSLSISLVAPGVTQLSWPSNFSDWQLSFATNLAFPANWQPVLETPIPLGKALMVVFPASDNSRYFRLVQSGSCLFRATPPAIAPGGTSTLTWCPVTGTTYRLSPGPGLVTGGSYNVSPPVTTLYTLIASNASGVISNFATVTVSSCSFANVTNWDGTLNFSYALAPSSGGYNFSVRHQAQLSLHLTRSSVSANGAQFTGYPTGTASMNDLGEDLTQVPIEPITIVGSGPPVQDVNLPATSQLTLDIDCNNGTYSFNIILQISATLTTTSGSTIEPSTAGTVKVLQGALPAALGTLSGSELLPARGPLWAGGGDLYGPGDLVADSMFITGAVNDSTAGNASVSWSFVPTP